MIENEHVRFIFPSSEREIAYFHKNRPLYDKAGVHLLINNAFILDTFLDKLKTADFFRQQGLPAPKTELLSAYKG